MPVEKLPWLARIVPNKVRFGAQALHKSKGTIYGLKLRATDPPVEMGDVVLVGMLSDQSMPLVQLCGTPLASKKTPLAALYELISRFRLRVAYSEQAKSEALAFTQKSGIDDRRLVDLTDRPYITIDNDDSRDLDQALYIEATPAGTLVSYALADASYYVANGGALFTEALARGSSYYLPGLSIPMLPRVLSEDLVSLNPNAMRRALVFDMTLNETGQCVDTSVYRGRIQSRAKLTYAGVQTYYDTPETSPLSNQPYSGTLDLLKVVGMSRRALAQAKHVVDFNRTGVKIARTPHVFTALADDRLWVERYNEQISLMCNVEGARLLEQASTDPAVQPVFRVHPAPPPEKLEAFERMILNLVEEFALAVDDWRWKRSEQEPLADYLRRLPGRKGDASAASRRIAAAIERQAIMTNIRSSFDAEPGVHHGIGAPFYARFSSPMREIVGIFTHKELLDHIEPDVSASTPSVDLELRESVIKAGNDSKALQKRLRKEANKLVIDELLQRELKLTEAERSHFVGTIMGIKQNCMYVQLDAPPLELKVYLSHLSRQYGAAYRVHESGIKVSGLATTPAFIMGACVELSVHGYDSNTNKWRLNVNLGG